MEFTHGRDRFYINEQEEACKQAPFLSNSTPFFSFPSSSSVPVRWHGGCGRGDDCYIEKEHMFDKVVTPSDVGKLNRLVIPKQHAERYFPLMDAGASQNGLLLGFEDRNGESWRFRYSYWSSSQSYVMTKGWSRFVKEKRLDAGDTVSFGRGVGESGRDRLYIDWKRRPQNHEAPRKQRIPFTGVSFGPCGAHRFMPPLPQGYGHNASIPSATGGQLLFFQSPATPLPPIEVQPGGGGGLSMVLDSVPVVVHRKAMGRGLRLFGVNLVSPESEGDVGVGGEGASPSSSRSQETSALPLLQLQPSSLDSSVASSSSTSKEQYSSLDLDL